MITVILLAYKAKKIMNTIVRFLKPSVLNIKIQYIDLVEYYLILNIMLNTCIIMTHSEYI